MKTPYNEIEWNVALEQLKMFINFKQNILQAKLEKNVFAYFDLIDSYFDEICQLIVFDHSEIDQILKRIRAEIHSIDKNKDGKLDDWEKMQSAMTFGRAMDDLQQVYRYLGKLLVIGGYTAKPVDIERKLKKLDEQHLREKYAVSQI